PVPRIPDGPPDEGRLAPQEGTFASPFEAPIRSGADGDRDHGSPPTESSGGIGLPGATGLGGGSGPGGGAPRGHVPLGANPRVKRIFQSSHLTTSQPIVKGGLRWLREHQSDEGLWDCDGFTLRCDPKLGPPCTGAGNPAFDVGVTGLALL